MNSREFIEMINEVTYEDFPQEIIIKAKLSFLDYVGVLLAGSNKKMATDLTNAIGEESLNDTCNFAFWAGTVARLLDLDDGHRFAMGHPGVPIISAALATSTSGNIDGKRFLESIVKGYEVYGFLGRVINPAAYQERGFDSTAICGAVASSMVAGIMYGLNNEELAHSVAISGSLCGGLNQYFEDGSSPKYLCAGWAAKLGIMSAKLAKSGLTGPLNIFDGKYGFCQGFSPRFDRKYLNTPKIEWEIGNTYFKIYACVRRIHAALDLVNKICTTENINYKEIDKITVYSNKFVADSAKYNPKNIVSAQSSLPFSIAVLLYYGEVDEDSIERGLENDYVYELSHKVLIVEDKKYEDLSKTNPSYWGPAAVEINTQGKSYKQETYIALGEKENPFSYETLKQKFLRLSTKVLSEEEANSMCERIMEIDQINKIDSLVKSIVNKSLMN